MRGFLVRCGRCRAQFARSGGTTRAEFALAQLGSPRTARGASADPLTLLGDTARLAAGTCEFAVNATTDGLLRFATGAVDGDSRAQLGLVAGTFGESIANAVVIARFETAEGAAEGAWDVTLERVTR